MAAPSSSLEPRIHLGRRRQSRQQRDPGQARAKFNIRYNDCHTQASLRALVEARLAKAAGNRIRAQSSGSRRTPTSS